MWLCQGRNVLRRWTELWRQLRELRQSAFSRLSPEDLLADFCAALLRCARWRLVQKYLAGTASVALDSGRAEALVLDCAKEYFYSATSLQSPEVAQVTPRLPMAWWTSPLVITIAWHFADVSERSTGSLMDCRGHRAFISAYMV